jgi:hypothetical protein
MCRKHGVHIAKTNMRRARRTQMRLTWGEGFAEFFVWIPHYAMFSFFHGIVARQTKNILSVQTISKRSVGKDRVRGLPIFFAMWYVPDTINPYQAKDVYSNRHSDTKAKV